MRLYRSIYTQSVCISPFCTPHVPKDWITKKLSPFFSTSHPTQPHVADPFTPHKTPLNLHMPKLVLHPNDSSRIEHTYKYSYRHTELCAPSSHLHHFLHPSIIVIIQKHRQAQLPKQALPGASCRSRPHNPPPHLHPTCLASFVLCALGVMQVHGEPTH